MHRSDYRVEAFAFGLSAANLSFATGCKWSELLIAVGQQNGQCQIGERAPKAKSWADDKTAIIEADFTALTVTALDSDGYAVEFAQGRRGTEFSRAV